MTPMRMVSIDPGTSTIGVAVHEFDDRLLKMIVVDAATIDAGFLAHRYYEDRVRTHGDKHARLYALRIAILRYLNAWSPATVCCEAPYMGRFPQAYGALVESISAIRYGIELYDPAMRLYLFDPATVKVAVGVSGKSGDKNAIRGAIRRQADLELRVNVDLLDEHAVDAIAVGYTHFASNIRGSY